MATNYQSYVTGSIMTFIDTLLMLLRWKDQGLEVHPINLDDEFDGWV